MTSMSTKTFHIGDILSITSGALVSPRHIGGVYDILGYMTGDELFTHQLPRAARECEGPLREQFPDLAAIGDVTFDIPDNASREEAGAIVYRWLDGIVAQHGETREVRPLDVADHTSIDPVAELRMLRPDAEIIAVRIDGAES